MGVQVVLPSRTEIEMLRKGMMMSIDALHFRVSQSKCSEFVEMIGSIWGLEFESLGLYENCKECSSLIRVRITRYFDIDRGVGLIGLIRKKFVCAQFDIGVKCSISMDQMKEC